MASNIIIQKYLADSDKALVSVIQLPTSHIAHVDMLFKIVRIVSQQSSRYGHIPSSFCANSLTMTLSFSKHALELYKNGII